MKKLIACSAVLILLILFGSCSGSDNSDKTTQNDTSADITTTYSTEATEFAPSTDDFPESEEISLGITDWYVDGISTSEIFIHDYFYTDYTDEWGGTWWETEWETGSLERDGIPLTLTALLELVSRHGNSLTADHFSIYYRDSKGYYPINDEFYVRIMSRDIIWLVQYKTAHFIDIKKHDILEFFVTNSLSPVVPDDFSFSLRWGIYGDSFYDSQTGKYVKTALDTGINYIVSYQLSDVEKLKIYQYVMSIDIFSYPDNYEPSTTPTASPYRYEYTLTVRYGGVEKTVVMENASGVTLEGKYIGYISVCQKVAEVLTQTPVWKYLPNNDS